MFYGGTFYQWDAGNVLAEGVAGLIRSSGGPSATWLPALSGREILRIQYHKTGRHCIGQAG